jgi:hypothetical protein
MVGILNSERQLIAATAEIAAMHRAEPVLAGTRTAQGVNYFTAAP